MHYKLKALSDTWYLGNYFGLNKLNEMHCFYCTHCTLGPSSSKNNNKNTFYVKRFKIFILFYNPLNVFCVHFKFFEILNWKVNSV
jgi:hypothetical protein